MSTQSNSPSPRQTLASSCGNPFATREQGQLRRAIIPVICVICIDATGSMDPFFNAMVRALNRVLEIFTNGSYEPYLGLVVFRDEKYGEMPAVYEVGTVPERITQILEETIPSGGGDEPESSLPALMRAVELIDSADVQAPRIILHITDAPTHPNEDGHTAESVLAAIQERGIIVFECTPAIEPYTTFANTTGALLFEIEPHMSESAFEDILVRFAKASVSTLAGPSVDMDDATKALLRQAQKPR